MIDDLDEALRQLLVREIPIKNSEIDISFDQPKREWSSRLSRPTLNLFMFDLNENNKLRAPQRRLERTENGEVTLRRTEIRVDAHYMVTAWAADPGDEHRILSHAMLALFRCPFLPEDLLPESLRNQPMPIPIEVAQKSPLQNALDVWSVLDNEMKPAFNALVTLALNPYMPFTAPLVRTRELRIGQASYPLSEQLDVQGIRDRIWTIGGKVHSAKPLEDVRLQLVERGQDVPVRPEHRFVIGNLEAGDYTLEISAEGRKPIRHKITVPSEEYDLEI
jgi:hypothetical protein